MKVSKNKRNVVVVSHKVVHQPDDDLVLYLNNKKYENVLHIMHSFANAKDRKSRYVWYKNGEKYREHQTKDFKSFPEPSLYVKEFYYTLKWTQLSNVTWDLYIGLDGLCVLFGNILRARGKVEKTIFWAIDFVPKNRFNLSIKNKIYQWINRSSDLKADELWDLSPRMLEGREKYLGIKQTDYKKHKLVQYGLWVDRIKPVAYKDCDKNTLVFVGNLSQYQGLQLIIQALPKLIKEYPNIRLKILGEGEYTPVIKKLANDLKVYKYCEFLGRINDTLEMEKIIAKAAIGLAPYMHELDYVSRYTDLGKIKTYLACGVPVITTDVPWNAKEIETQKCGLIITEYEEDIIKKIKFLMDSKHNEAYRNNALKYAKSFNFQEIFDKNFPNDSLVKMNVLKHSKNIVIISHKVVHLCDDDLVEYLNKHKYDNVMHIMHSFANARDRRSKYSWYKKGKLFKQVETRDYKFLPEFLLYFKEFYYTLKWIFDTKIVWGKYIALDGLCAFFGNTLKLLRRVEYTCYWVIDFVPYDRFSSPLKNYIYRFINSSGYKKSDELWDLSPRMAPARKKYLNISLSDVGSHRIVPIGAWTERIEKIPYQKCSKNTIIFVGNIAKYQGVQLIIDSIPDIIQVIPKFKFKIIGSGDYGTTVKELANRKGVMKYCSFLGQFDDHVKLEKEIAKSAVAVAPYLKKMKNISYFADLAKVKTYLACGVPIIVTDIPWNAAEIAKLKCGTIVEEDNKSIVNALQLLFKPAVNKKYRENAIAYAKRFDYNNIFNGIFNDNQKTK